MKKKFLIQVEYEFDEEGEIELKAQDVEFRKDPDDKSYPPESE